MPGRAASAGGNGDNPSNEGERNPIELSLVYLRQVMHGQCCYFAQLFPPSLIIASFVCLQTEITKALSKAQAELSESEGGLEKLVVDDKVRRLVCFCPKISHLPHAFT